MHKFYTDSSQNWFSLDSGAVLQDHGEPAKFNAPIISAPTEYSFHCQLVGTGNCCGIRLIPFSNEARHWDIFISEFQVSTHCHFRCYSKSYHLPEYIWYHIYLQHSNFSLYFREYGKKLGILILDIEGSASKTGPTYILQGESAQFLIISDTDDSIRNNNWEQVMDNQPEGLFDSKGTSKSLGAKIKL